MSLDGFIAGPNSTLEQPLGEGGENLHEWVIKLQSWRRLHSLTGGETGVDDDIVEESSKDIGAVIMGRKMFSGGEGPWDEDPNPDGWWGETPPFHAPVFILTQNPRESVTKQGGTTFNFVTDGIESALKQAKAAAGGKNISIAGGANVIQQYLNAGVIDELEIHLVPILLGGGIRLLENITDEKVKLKKIRVIDSPTVTHLRFQTEKL